MEFPETPDFVTAETVLMQAAQINNMSQLYMVVSELAANQQAMVQIITPRKQPVLVPGAVVLAGLQQYFQAVGEDLEGKEISLDTLMEELNKHWEAANKTS